MKKLSFLLLFSAVLFSACNDKREGDFAYIFDSTAKPGKEHSAKEMFGNHEFHKIKFDSNESDKEALSAFRALKSSILFENRNGKNIFLRGKFVKSTGLFRLDHWYITTPFMERKFVKTEYSPRPKVKLMQRRRLLVSDFYGKIDFDPAKYQNRRSKHYRHVYGGSTMDSLSGE
ncbi:MAG: hypothetical protein ACYTFY_08125 [Planctomycetota bacterium]|jgi:hypothetical protein